MKPPFGKAMLSAVPDPPPKVPGDIQPVQPETEGLCSPPESWMVQSTRVYPSVYGTDT